MFGGVTNASSTVSEKIMWLNFIACLVFTIGKVVFSCSPIKINSIRRGELRVKLFDLRPSKMAGTSRRTNAGFEINKTAAVECC